MIPERLPEAWKDHPEYGECRILGKHDAPRVGDYDFDLKNGLVFADYQCRRCKTRIARVWNFWTGVMKSREYQHPEGYLMPGRKRTKGANNRLRVSLFRAIMREQRQKSRARA